MGKSAALPQVRVEPRLRVQVEEALHPGESLSEFVEAAVVHAIGRRQRAREANARADAALDQYRRTGESYSADEVLARLRELTEARRQALMKTVATAAGGTSDDPKAP